MIPWAVSYQAPLSVGFSRQEYWSGLPCPPPGNLPNPGIELRSPVLQAVQSLSCVQIIATPWTCSMPGFPVHHQLPRLIQTQVQQVVMPSNHLILCRPLLLPSVFPSIRIFSNESVLCIRWPKYWSFSFSTSPSNKYSGPISFSMDWFDLLAVQGTLKSLFQHHSSKASILSFLYSPTVISIHDYWKKHSFELDGPLSAK